MRPVSLLVSTSGYAYYHPLYSRPTAFIDYLSKSNHAGLHVDVLLTRPFTILRTKWDESSRLGWLEVPIPRFAGTQRQVEMGYHLASGLGTLLRKTLRYDTCFAMDLDGWALGYLARKIGLVQKLAYNDQDHYPTFLKEHKLQAFAADMMERFAIRNSDLVITVSRKLAQFRKHQGCRRVEIVPNGVDVELFSNAKARRRASQRGRRFIFAGYLGGGWGLETMIQAFCEATRRSPMSLTIVGDGPIRQTLETQVKSLGLSSNVFFVGKVNHRNLPDYFGQADFGIAPYEPGSPADFNSSLKVREYMAAGLPVITTKVGDLPDLMTESQAGLTVNCTVEELSGALLQMSSYSQAVYQQMSEAATKYVATHYDWPFLFDRLVDLLLR